MAEFNSYGDGVPSWVDLASPDLDASAAFYGALLGWEVTDLGPEAGGYRMCVKGGKQVAGMGPIMMEGQPSAWTTYVSQSDADAAVAKVKAAGGMVFVEPMDVMAAGRRAIAADPTGAAFGIWQPKEHIGAQLANEPGAFCWNELNSRDVPAAEGFYSQVFGWNAKDAGMEGMDYFEWQLDGKPVGGMMPMPEMVPAEVPSYWLTYFAVEDTDAAVATVTAGGGRAVVPPTDIPPGRFAVLMDPNGAAFAVLKMAQAA